MKLFIFVLALLISFSSKADEAPINVVKIISFSCNVCRASEAIDPILSTEVRRRGGQFVWAPIPVAESDFLGVKERVYYASRTLDSELSLRVKESMYKASQDVLVPLTTFAQAHSWLTQDLLLDSETAQKIINQAQTPEGLVPLRRAFLLVKEGGISAVPSYLLIKNGKILKSFDMTQSNIKSFSDLRDSILAELYKKD